MKPSILPVIVIILCLAATGGLYWALFHISVPADDNTVSQPASQPTIATAATTIPTATETQAVILENSTPEPTPFVTVSSTPIPIQTTARPTPRPTLTPTPTPAPSGLMTVYYIDVGEGDSELIVSPSGKTMLIDAGDVGQEANIITTLDSLNITHLNYVVATHPHSDHIGGMVAIINKYTVGQFVDSGSVTTTPVFKNMIKAIDEKGITFTTTTKGDTIDFDPLIDIEVMNPGTLLSTGNFDENSIFMKMVFNQTAFLFTGDADANIERCVLDVGHVNILKVGHHGDNAATSQFLLSATTPDYCIISVKSGNIYGFPSMDAIARMKSAGCKVYRTDIDGTITATSDGEVVHVVGSH